MNCGFVAEEETPDPVGTFRRHTIPSIRRIPVPPTPEQRELLSQIGERIKAARGDLSQRDLAARSKMDVSTISRIERGSLNPSVTTLQAIADALGRNITHLLGEPISLLPGTEVVKTLVLPDPRLDHLRALEERVSELTLRLNALAELPGQVQALSSELAEALTALRSQRILPRSSDTA